VVELSVSDSSAGPIVPPHHFSITTVADPFNLPSLAGRGGGGFSSRGASARHSRDRCVEPNGYPSLTGTIEISHGMTPRPERSIGYFLKESRKKKAKIGAGLTLTRRVGRWERAVNSLMMHRTTHRYAEP
jgi:hypothetical protein